MGWGGYTQLNPALQTNKQPNNHPIIVPLKIFCWTYWTVEIWKTAIRTDMSHTRPTILDQTWAYHTGLDRTRPDPTVLDQTGPDRTWLDHTGSDRTVPYRTVPYRTVPYRTVPYRTVPDFHRTFTGLSQDFLRTFSGLAHDFLQTFSVLSSGHYQNYLRNFSGLFWNNLKTFFQVFGLFHDFPVFSHYFLRTFSELSELSQDPLRKFSGLSQ